MERLRNALLLHGRIGSVDRKADLSPQGPSLDILRIGAEAYKETILRPNAPMDVFVHCWDYVYSKEIDGCYSPVSSIYQQPIFFNSPVQENSNLVQKYNGKPGVRTEGHYSRWYSALKVWELFDQYRNAHEHTYRMAMLARFDQELFHPLDFSTLDPSVVNGGSINEENKALSDFWLISSPEIIGNICNLYTAINMYRNRKSPYYIPRMEGRISSHMMLFDHVQHLGVKHVTVRKHISEYELIRRTRFGAPKHG